MMGKTKQARPRSSQKTVAYREVQLQNMMAETTIRERYNTAGQGHVFRNLKDLEPEETKAFMRQLDEIPVEKLSTYLEAALAGQASIGESMKIKPFSKHVGRSTNKDEVLASYKIGLEAIGNGEVATLVLAGGQGTRLGFTGPKGMYNIGMPSSRTLFQMVSERILKLRELASRSSEYPSLPFYIMTSPINHNDTVRYFEQNNFFGLPRDDVHFFEQGMLPCLTNEGKIILETASKVAMAPDGNGGIYPSLKDSGMLMNMENHGVKYLHVFSIDNALTKPADPAFIGHCISQGADCGNKVVWKSSADEKVGVIAEDLNGKPCVVEYSDITTEMAASCDSTGRLLFGAGNICNHFYTLDFLKNTILPRLGSMYHIARKKIPYYNEDSKSTVKPETNNGIKLESFIFDVFPLSRSMAIYDVLREEEFAPVKNAPGEKVDSPDSARAYLSNLAKKWVTDAGGILTGKIDCLCEIAPSRSYGGEGLEDLNGNEIECPFSL